MEKWIFYTYRFGKIECWVPTAHQAYAYLKEKTGITYEMAVKNNDYVYRVQCFP